jgi:hypothetical protein
MSWFWRFEKLVEDGTAVIYEYGYDVPLDVSGIIEYDKITGEITISKKADKDFPDGEWTKEKFHLLIKDGFPDKKTIAI